MPKLITTITTGHRSDYTSVTLLDAELPCTCPTDEVLAPHERDCLAIGVIIHDMVKYHELAQAVSKAISEALAAGQAEWEYHTGEEYARERLEGDDGWFTADGDRHS
jgi:hypothetical protein